MGQPDMFVDLSKVRPSILSTSWFQWYLYKRQSPARRSMNNICANRGDARARRALVCLCVYICVVCVLKDSFVSAPKCDLQAFLTTWVFFPVVVDSRVCFRELLVALVRSIASKYLHFFSFYQLGYSGQTNWLVFQQLAIGITCMMDRPFLKRLMANMLNLFLFVDLEFFLLPSNYIDQSFLLSAWSMPTWGFQIFDGERGEPCSTMHCVALYRQFFLEYTVCSSWHFIIEGKFFAKAVDSITLWVILLGKLSLKENVFSKTCACRY